MNPLLQRVLKISRKCKRLPSLEECLEAIENPETAKPEVTEYLRISPEFKEYMEKLLKLQ